MTHIEKPKSNIEKRGENEHRITVAGVRRMLGMIGKNYSDEDISEILDVLYGIAEDAFEVYLCDAGTAEECFEAYPNESERTDLAE